MKLNTFITTILLCLQATCVISQEYPIHITDQGYIIVSIKLNDSVPANFMLDTGAGAIVLSSKTFDKVKKSAEESGYFTGFRHDGDRLDGQVYKIPSISIGAHKINGPLIGVYPPLDNYGIEGLISLKFFEDKPFTIDFTNKKLIMLSNNEVDELAKNHIVLPMFFGIKGNVSLDVFIPIVINDKVTIHAEFDTGSGYKTFLVNPYFISQLQLNRNIAKTQAYKTVLSQEKRTDSIFNLDKVAFGNVDRFISRQNVTASFREGLIYEGLIGSGLFKETQVTIDIPSKRFIIHQ